MPNNNIIERLRSPEALSNPLCEEAAREIERLQVDAPTIDQLDSLITLLDRSSRDFDRHAPGLSFNASQRLKMYSIVADWLKGLGR